MDRNDSDISVRCNLMAGLNDVCQVSNMIYISHSVGKVMACYKHTPTYRLSMFGACIEAGWSMATVCLEYVKPDNMLFVHGKLSTAPHMYKRNLTEVYTGFVCLSANKSGFVASWA